MRHAATLLPVLLIPLLLVPWLAVGRAAGGPEAGPWEGTVLDPDGRPLEGATVWLRDARAGCLLVPGETLRRAVTDRGGAFRFERPAAPATLRVVHPAHAPLEAPARSGARLRLRRAAWLEVDAPRDAQVVVARGTDPLPVLRRASGWRLGPLPPDETLTLVVRSPRHRTHLERFRLADGEQRRVEVRLDPGLAVRGRVVPPRAGVRLRASQGEARESVALSASDGTFLLEGLRPGPLRVVALTDEGEVVVADGRVGEDLVVRMER